ncbi:MAG TPA: S8 family serine peptidase [Gaiellaceae bacterium]
MIIRRLACILTVSLLAAPSSALASNWAVGAGPGGVAGLRAQLPGAATLVPGRALLVRGARPHVRGAAYVLRLDSSHRRLAFSNNEPLGPQQWYFASDSAWTHWPAPPNLQEVKVAVIDTGIDAGHPEFAGRIAAGRSFVDTSWKTDGCGHGTYVAGLIAANPFNGVGIAGIAFNARLLVAKVALADCGVSETGEILAIKWAVQQGARVINISIGGNRDPEDSNIDQFSALEEAAIQYATSKGVLVVAASGNTEGPTTPWTYADYPAALPHVLGVGAVTQPGAVPAYSNRDKLFVDLAAPGGPLLSTIPRSMVEPALPGCANQAFSNCGPAEYRTGVGTSFATPQVTAAAALLLGVDPRLKPDQVAWLLERSATDASPSSGCPGCPAGRDSLAGWGTLDVASALDLVSHRSDLPTADALEPNDNANTPGAVAHALKLPRSVSATLDYWDDPIDVYSVTLQAGSRFFARLGTGSFPGTTLVLWKPGTTDVTVPLRSVLSDRAARSAAVSGQQRLGYRVAAAGTYYLEVKTGAPSRAPERYRLSLSTTG